MRRARLALLGAAIASALSILAAPATAARGIPGLRVLGSQQIDGRLTELTLSSDDVTGPTGVRVLLPSGYAGSHRRYPVLYLLHGAADDFRSWTVKGDAEALTAGLPLIVVMPDSGPTGGYVNWFNDGRFGPPKWESYHLGQLIPFIDRRYRTDGTRAGRAVAGLSMGGGGAMHYAARHPDLFAAAASFSGAVDTNNALDIAVTPPQVYGPRDTEEVRWRGHNPWDLAENLRPVDLTIRTGNGEPGGPFGGGDIVEATVHAMSVSLHRKLVGLGIHTIWDDYGPGGHTWPYWQRDLRETLPHLIRVFARPRPAPRSVTFRSIDSRYSVFGWRVRIKRKALEFSRLSGARRGGFTLSGSGSAVVRTAPILAPDTSYRARIHTRLGTKARTIHSDSHGRARLHFVLGPANPKQEYLPGATTRVYRATVSMRPVTGSAAAGSPSRS